MACSRQIERPRYFTGESGRKYHVTNTCGFWPDNKQPMRGTSEAGFVSIYNDCLEDEWVCVPVENVDEVIAIMQRERDILLAHQEGDNER